MSALEGFIRRNKASGIAYLQDQAYRDLASDASTEGHWELKGGFPHLAGIKIVLVEASTETYRSPRGLQDTEDY